MRQSKNGLYDTASFLLSLLRLCIIDSDGDFVQCGHQGRRIGKNALLTAARIFQAEAPGDQLWRAAGVLLPDGQEIDAVIGRFRIHNQLMDLIDVLLRTIDLEYAIIARV
jgi:hypothetical protein